MPKIIRDLESRLIEEARKQIEEAGSFSRYHALLRSQLAAPPAEVCGQRFRRGFCRRSAADLDHGRQTL